MSTVLIRNTVGQKDSMLPAGESQRLTTPMHRITYKPINHTGPWKPFLTSQQLPSSLHLLFRYQTSVFREDQDLLRAKETVTNAKCDSTCTK